MRQGPFSRPTIVAATGLLEQHTQARFNQTVVRLGLEDDVSQDTTVSVGKKIAMLGKVVVARADQVLQTVDGPVTLAEAVVREAAQLAQPASTEAVHTDFLRGLARDGFVLVPAASSGQRASIRAALPSEVQLPAKDDEVHHLLKQFGFSTPLGHLDQAVDAHTRGDWAACNGQLRAFMEGLFDDIARYIDLPQAVRLPTAENRRGMLGSLGFLDASSNEWSGDGKNYVNGLFKMLHTQGAHPGLSDQDHSTFRLHLVLVTAGMYLRRLTRLRPHP
ncbi:hypothetical protein FHY16_002586 [Xanthomonas campestris]|uniref:hypothetical protein n=1 Tax=Xanthomonas euroxanthea TaxID=2259622 RepID=UPI00160771D3|nr:hypothetical protein [Xanthomonas euroxanthea]MBB3779816.1 hypothetical protein [Xanthomonas euroxanthea]